MSEHAFDRYTEAVRKLYQAADQLRKAGDLIRSVGKDLQDNPQFLFSVGGDPSKVGELQHHWPDSERLRELLDAFQNAQEAEEKAFNALGYDNRLIDRPTVARQ